MQETLLVPQPVIDHEEAVSYANEAAGLPVAETSWDSGQARGTRQQIKGAGAPKIHVQMQSWLIVASHVEDRHLWMYCCDELGRSRELMRLAVFPNWGIRSIARLSICMFARRLPPPLPHGFSWTLLSGSKACDNQDTGPNIFPDLSARRHEASTRMGCDGYTTVLYVTCTTAHITTAV